MTEPFDFTHFTPWWARTDNIDLALSNFDIDLVGFDCVREFQGNHYGEALPPWVCPFAPRIPLTERVRAHRRGDNDHKSTPHRAAP